MIGFRCLLDHCFSHNALGSPEYCFTLGTYELRLQNSSQSKPPMEARLEFARTAFFLFLRPVFNSPYRCTRIVTPCGSSAGSGILVSKIPSVYSKGPSDRTVPSELCFVTITISSFTRGESPSVETRYRLRSPSPGCSWKAAINSGSTKTRGLSFLPILGCSLSR